MNARRLLTLSLVGFLLSGSGCSSGPHRDPTVEFEGRQYQRLAVADVPIADLRPVGSATLRDVSDVTDPTVLALRDVDPAVLIVLNIDAARMEPDDSGRPPRSHALLGARRLEAFPASACRYFDSRAEASPVDCQVPITVVFEGRRYRALEPFVAKAGPAGLHFAASDVTAAGVLSDIDPRLYEVNPAGHVIDGVDPTEAIVVVRGVGEDAEYLPFIAEGLAGTPASMCDFRDEQDPDAAEAAPSDCPRPDPTR